MCGSNRRRELVTPSSNTLFPFFFRFRKSFGGHNLEFFQDHFLTFLQQVTMVLPNRSLDKFHHCVFVIWENLGHDVEEVIVVLV